MFLNCSLCPLFHTLSICFKKVFIWASCQKQNTETVKPVSLPAMFAWFGGNFGVVVQTRKSMGGDLFFRFSCRNLGPPHPLNHPHLVNPSAKNSFRNMQRIWIFCSKILPCLTSTTVVSHCLFDDFRSRANDLIDIAGIFFFLSWLSLETPTRMSHSGVLAQQVGLPRRLILRHRRFVELLEISASHGWEGKRCQVRWKERRLKLPKREPLILVFLLLFCKLRGYDYVILFEHPYVLNGNDSAFWRSPPKSISRNPSNSSLNWW